MKKKTLHLKDLGKAHTKEHLRRIFPFLKQPFRELSYKEITSETVFKELFPNEPIDLSKLKAIYEYQK